MWTKGLLASLFCERQLAEPDRPQIQKTVEAEVLKLSSAARSTCEDFMAGVEPTSQNIVDMFHRKGYPDKLGQALQDRDAVLRDTDRGVGVEAGACAHHEEPSRRAGRHGAGQEPRLVPEGGDLCIA